MSKYVIGVDLGGTQIRSVLATTKGEIVARDQRWTLADEGPEAVIARIIDSIEDVRAQSGIAGRVEESIGAIGIGAPGPTDPHRGVVLMGPNLPGWFQVDLRDELYRPFGVPVYIGNDANLAGLAELRFGAGRGVDHMIYITQSTGIGGGIFSAGRMVVGAQGLAAEIGHMTIDLSQDDPERNIVGTFEGLCAGPDIALRAQEHLRAGATSMALDLAEGRIEEITTKELGEAAQLGDRFALEEFRQTGILMGVGITNLLHIFNPQRIVIGGGVWQNCSVFMQKSMWETIKRRTRAEEYWRWLDIVSAELGSDVGLLGAVALALDESRADASTLRATHAFARV